MRIIIYGTGGVGGYFGGRLAQAGEDVVFIARGEHLRAIRAHGLKVDSIKGNFIVHPAQATDDPAEAGIADAVLVCVKAWQIPEVSQALKLMIGPQTSVIFLGNGVDALGQLTAALGAAPLLGGMCRISSFLSGPGHIQHVGIDPSLAFGELDNRPSERAARLLDAFQKAGVKAETPPDIHVTIWQKFLFIAAVSGVGAATRAPIGVIRSTPETRQVLESALREVEAVGRARGIALPEDATPRTLAMIDRLPEDTLPSMQRDIEMGRPSELEAQSGAVARMGQELGIPTPTHTMLYALLLPQELKARGKI